MKAAWVLFIGAALLLIALPPAYADVKSDVHTYLTTTNSQEMRLVDALADIQRQSTIRTTSPAVYYQRIQADCDKLIALSGDVSRVKAPLPCARCHADFVTAMRQFKSAAELLPQAVRPNAPKRYSAAFADMRAATTQLKIALTEKREAQQKYDPPWPW